MSNIIRSARRGKSDTWEYTIKGEPVSYAKINLNDTLVALGLGSYEVDFRVDSVWTPYEETFWTLKEAEDVVLQRGGQIAQELIQPKPDLVNRPIKSHMNKLAPTKLGHCFIVTFFTHDDQKNMTWRDRVAVAGDSVERLIDALKGSELDDEKAIEALNGSHFGNPGYFDYPETVPGTDQSRVYYMFQPVLKVGRSYYELTPLS